MFDFRAPFFLILIAAIPVLIVLQRRAHLGTATWRKRVIFCLRGTALLCAILALADLHRTHREQRIAVAFLLDTSESISPTQHEEALQQIYAAAAQLKPTDPFGIISFAKETAVLREVRSKQALPVEDPSAVLLEMPTEQTLGRDSTDVLRALKHAIALLPERLSPPDCSV